MENLKKKIKKKKKQKDEGEILIQQNSREQSGVFINVSHKIPA
jgi:hypothetical protein